MGTRIPLPDNKRSGLFEGLMAGNKRQDEQQNMERQWHQHEENKQLQYKQLEQYLMQHMQQQAIREQAEARHAAEFEFNKSKQPLDLELLREKIEYERAKQEKARREPSSNAKPSEAERMAEALSGGDPEKKAEILSEIGATKYGITMPGTENLPVGSQSFKSLPKNLQAQENADQIKMQTSVNNASKAMHDLDEMQKIIKSHPNMARDLSYLLGNPEDKSFLANLSRRYLDKKELAAIEKFTKYSNDFVLSAGDSLGNNFTDAKLKALQLSKMHAGNTDESNKAIIANYKNRLKPMINYGKELKKARGKYTLPYFEQSYTDEALGNRSIEDLSDEELEALSGGY
jgi:hypothetical protein